MSFGNLGAASGAQPAAGPTGAPIWLDTGPAAFSAPVGQAGNPSPYGGPSYFGNTGESVLAAMSRGELPANIGVSAPALGVQVSLLQAMSQGVPQNGTNGIGVSSGPAGATGTGGESGTSFGGTQPVDAKQMSSVPSLTAQYSGN